MAKVEKKKTAEACKSAVASVQDALYVLNGKWKLPVIIALSEGHKRFGDIQKSVTGIAAKVLSSELKNLELNGFVVRHVYNEFPVLVEYKLTGYSDSLKPVIDSLYEWGANHSKKIRADFQKANAERKLSLK